MQLIITFPGGKRVDADLGGQVVRTDQPPKEGGGGSAPTPFETFLASLGTCAGFYIMEFCSSRGISTDGIRIVQETAWDQQAHRLSAVKLTIEVPEGFPEKYRGALVRAADQCTVKRVIATPPVFEIETKVV